MDDLIVELQKISERCKKQSEVYSQQGLYLRSMNWQSAAQQIDKAIFFLQKSIRHDNDF